MPWLAVPPSEPLTLASMQKKHSIVGVPTLLIFSPDGELITRDGVGAISADPQGTNFPWEGYKPSISQDLVSRVLRALPGLVMSLLMYLALRFIVNMFINNNDALSERLPNWLPGLRQ